MYLSNNAEEIYDVVQYELSDEERYHLYEHFINQKCDDIDTFWDWWESLESDDVEEIGLYIDKNFKHQEQIAIYKYAVEGKFSTVCGEGDIGEKREISVKVFESESEAIEYAQRKIKEISDNYGYNFINVYDKDCEEIISLDK